MKTLIIFYSRTGTTRKIAVELQKILKADIEELYDKNRSGPVGYMLAGREATLKKVIKIKQPKKDPKKYDLIILGTPVWAFTMCSAIRTYLTANKLKKVAFFCTMDGSGNERTFKHMEELSSKPKAKLTLLTKQVWREDIKKQLKDFAKQLKK